MNAQTTLPRFNAYAAYEAEREVNRRLFEVLGRVLIISDNMADLLEREGYDVSVKRQVLDNARKERLA